MVPAIEELDPSFNPALIVHREHEDRSPSRWCLTHEKRPFKPEMVRPGITPRMKKLHDFAALRVNP